MTMQPVSILGVGMTDLSRRDLTPEQMAEAAVAEALRDAEVPVESIGLVLVGNALGGRLCDQGCIRGQCWLRKAGLSNAGTINIDNSCAGGSSAVHLGVLAAIAHDRPVLVVGVEKMWTGDRAATLAGIEDGLPRDFRADMHARADVADNPAGSILMGLNAGWARQHMEERGTTVEQIAAAAVKARRHASLNPLAQVHKEVTLDEVLSAPPVAGVLTRPMCSSFTDGAAALVLGGPAVPAGDRVAPVSSARWPVPDTDSSTTTTGSTRWRARHGTPSGSAPRTSTSSSCMTPRAPRSSTPSSRSGSSRPARRVRRRCPVAPASAAEAITVNPSGGLVARGHPLAATGLAQIVELAVQVGGRAGARQVAGARLGVAVNTGGVIEGDAAFVGVHAVAGA